MKKFIVLVLTPLISISVIVLKIPKIDNYLEQTIGADGSLWIGIALVATSLFVYYLNIGVPFLINEKLAKNRWQAIKKTVDNFITTYKDHMDLNVNILKPKTKYLVLLEPTKNDKTKAKLSFRRKVFKLVWQDENSSYDPSFRFTTNQGLCGNVFSEGGKTKSVIFGSNHTYKFYFTEKQEKSTEDLTTLASCPIKSFNYEGHGQDKKVLGVINVESKSPEAAIYLSNEENRARFHKSVDRLEEFVRHLV